MLGRLAENGCDKQEIIDRGNKIVPPNVDPDFLESGGTTGGATDICNEWYSWFWWAFGGFGSSSGSGSAWTMKVQAEGLRDLDFGAVRFTGVKSGAVTGPNGGSGTFSIAGNALRIQMTQSVVEDGKSVTLTYTFLGARTPEALGGTYTLERSDGGLPKRGNWRAEKR
jgi:hypothetical protein